MRNREIIPAILDTLQICNKKFFKKGLTFIFYCCRIRPYNCIRYQIHKKVKSLLLNGSGRGGERNERYI